MRLTHRALLALGVFVALLASSRALAQKNVGGLASDVASEKEIHTLYAKFTEAWNRHDTDALGMMWTLDGDHLEPDGRAVKGRAAVATLLKEQHGSVFKKTTLTLAIDSVWLVTADVALADGTYEIAGIAAPDGTAVPKRAGHLTSILLREDGKWWIVASRLMIPTSLPYKKS